MARLCEFPGLIVPRLGVWGMKSPNVPLMTQNEKSPVSEQTAKRSTIETGHTRKVSAYPRTKKPQSKTKELPTREAPFPYPVSVPRFRPPEIAPFIPCRHAPHAVSPSRPHSPHEAHPADTPPFPAHNEKPPEPKPRGG